MPEAMSYESCFVNFNWDAGVAIGTFLLALVTVAAIVVPICLDVHRTRNRVNLNALMFDHELSVIEGVMIRRAYQTSAIPNTGDTVRILEAELLFSHPRINLPLMERLVEQLVFMGQDVADKLAVALSAVAQIRKNAPPESLHGVPIDDIGRLTRNVHGESLTLLMQARKAREALRTIRRTGPPLPAMNPIHENLRTAYEAILKKEWERQQQAATAA